MSLFLTVLHVLVCFFLIIVVLLQRGKGAEIGAVFGGGGSSTVFGSRGAGNFLTRLTAIAAATFMVTSLSLAYFAKDGSRTTIFDADEGTATEASPFAEPEAGGFEEVAPESPAGEPGGFEEVGEPAAAPQQAPPAAPVE